MLSQHFLKRRNNWLRDCLFLGAGLVIFYLAWLGSYPFFTPDEGRYVEIAREMVASGDYLTPTLNGVPFFDKPILYYWLQTFSIRLFGLSEWTARLVPALMGVLGCLFTYLAGRKLYDRRTGLYAALILATSPLYFGAAHYANLDLEVAVWISASLLCWITGFRVSSFVFAAFACLTKGLIGLVFPILIIGSWIIVLHQWKVLKNRSLYLGFLLFASLTLPWYLLVQQANPGFFHYFFVTQQFTRFVSGQTFNNPTPIWFYLPIVLITFVPWSLFLIFALIKTFKASLSAPNKHSQAIFLLIWISVIFIFFSIPHSKIITYILPIFPALALLVGRYLSQSRLPRFIFIGCVAVNVIGLLLLVMNASHLNTNSTKQLAQTILSLKTPQDEVIGYFKYYYDLPLYLQARITVVADWEKEDIVKRDNWLREFSSTAAPHLTHSNLITEKTFWKRWQSRERLFVLLNNNYLGQFKSHVSRYYVLGKQGHTILISNQPLSLKPVLN